jgi:hypothetical protein
VHARRPGPPRAALHPPTRAALAAPHAARLSPCSSCSHAMQLQPRPALCRIESGVKSGRDN